MFEDANVSPGRRCCRLLCPNSLEVGRTVNGLNVYPDFPHPSVIWVIGAILPEEENARVIAERES